MYEAHLLSVTVCGSARLRTSPHELARLLALSQPKVTHIVVSLLSQPEIYLHHLCSAAAVLDSFAIDSIDHARSLLHCARERRTYQST